MSGGGSNKQTSKWLFRHGLEQHSTIKDVHLYGAEVQHSVQSMCWLVRSQRLGRRTRKRTQSCELPTTILLDVCLLSSCLHTNPLSLWSNQGGNNCKGLLRSGIECFERKSRSRTRVQQWSPAPTGVVGTTGVGGHYRPTPNSALRTLPPPPPYRPGPIPIHWRNKNCFS